MRKTSRDVSEPKAASAQKRPRRRWWRRLGIVALIVIMLLGIGRLMLPRIVRSYVNRTLDQSPLYKGRIGDISIHLWRGAYSIQDVRLVKITGDVPVPLYAAKRVDFTIEWSALLRHKLVGQVVMFQPELNFVDAPSDSDSQTGQGGPWLKMIEDLFPFKIDSARVIDGSVHFRTFQSAQPIDVYLGQLDAGVDNLTNIHNDTTPLVTTVNAHAKAMGQADFDYQMRLDPASYYPSYHLAARLVGLDVTKTNDLVRKYGGFDFKGGWFDLVIEIDAKGGMLQGYVKPLFRNLRVFDISRDVRNDNPIQFFWQALVAGAEELLKNQPRDQFGTLIPFTADETGTKPDILATVGNVLRNGFIRAYLPKLQRGAVPDQQLEFEKPTPLEATPPGDQP